MENPSSPLDTLRQLKEMLDAGALTPAEFDALKQRLVIAPGTAAPAAGPPVPRIDSSWPPEAAAAFPETAAAPFEPALPPLSAPYPAPYPTAAPEPFAHEALSSGTEEALLYPSDVHPADAHPADAHPADAYASDAHANAAGNYYEPAPELPAEEPAEYFDPAPAERNSSLGLLLAIGAVLVFLGVVAYLGFTRPASEHISSTSQTAADSLVTTIETGPQVAPLPATAVAPETVRVAPTNPAPALPSRSELERQAAVRDSAASTAAPVAPDSTVRQ